MVKNIWIKIITYALILLTSVILLTNYVTYAQNSTVPTNTPIEEFEIRGTEPFWSIDISKRTIIFSTPNAKKQTFAYVVPLSAIGRTPDSLRVYRLRGDNTLIIKKASACSDGMSETEYPYSATFISGNRVLAGCAEKK